MEIPYDSSHKACTTKSSVVPTYLNFDWHSTTMMVCFYQLNASVMEEHFVLYLVKGLWNNNDNLLHLVHLHYGNTQTHKVHSEFKVLVYLMKRSK